MFGIFPKEDLTLGEVRDFPKERLNAWRMFGIFLKEDLTHEECSGFSRMLHRL